ncbi:MAG: zinc-ribbon domain-containing protein [Oscillospiraceae bacterium]|nr:zinc-ribbon domain-containing protein [Oscillospiraceae bacterium]
MYNNFSAEMASVFSAMAGLFIFIGIISIAIGVLTIVALWKLFEKAGEPGWAALIPFYNAYVLFKISWGNGWFFLLSVVPAILYEVVYIGFFTKFIANIVGHGMDKSFNDAFVISTASSAISMSLILFVLWAAMLAVNIIFCIKLAKVFGQGGGFACGLFFLEVVFICIIAFSKNIHYIGIPGKIPPYGVGGGQPRQPNGYGPQGYQNPYYQPNGYQQGYQNPYYRPNDYQQQGYQNPYYQPNAYQAPNLQPTEQKPDGFKQQAPASGINMYCPECGTRLESGEKVCPKCGKEQ